MTSVDRDEASRHAHYRRAGGIAPGNGSDFAVDITERPCIPCAVVFVYRPADLLSSDGTPMCWAHGEFEALSEAERSRIVLAWTRYGSYAVGLTELCAQLRQARS